MVINMQCVKFFHNPQKLSRGPDKKVDLTFSRLHRRRRPKIIFCTSLSFEIVVVAAVVVAADVVAADVVVVVVVMHV